MLRLDGQPLSGTRQLVASWADAPDELPDWAQPWPYKFALPNLNRKALHRRQSRPRKAATHGVTIHTLRAREPWLLPFDPAIHGKADPLHDRALHAARIHWESAPYTDKKGRRRRARAGSYHCYVSMHAGRAFQAVDLQRAAYHGGRLNDDFIGIGLTQGALGKLREPRRPSVSALSTKAGRAVTHEAIETAMELTLRIARHYGYGKGTTTPRIGVLWRRRVYSRPELARLIAKHRFIVTQHAHVKKGKPHDPGAAVIAEFVEYGARFVAIDS
ncbi:MAG: N-acetylmuramoyl-L-alanine amidase [Myxococcota bacterium]